MAKLSVEVGKDDHVQGPADAPFTLVEYGDYECPSCGDAYPVVKKLQKHFGNKLRFAFRNFPLEQHEFAEPAAETAEFAASEGKFWEMHDALYENQAKMSDELFSDLAERLGLDADALSEALQKGSFEGKVQADLESGQSSGLRGTPTFYLNGEQHSGSFQYDILLEAIEAKLKK